MFKRVIGISSIALLLSSTAFADAASGLPTGKRQHQPAPAPQVADKESADEATPAMNKAELTETLAEKPSSPRANDNNEDSDSDVMIEMNKAHKPGGGMTGQSRRRAVSDEDNVAEKTDKTDAARAKKRQP